MSFDARRLADHSGSWLFSLHKKDLTWRVLGLQSQASSDEVFSVYLLHIKFRLTALTIKRLSLMPYSFPVFPTIP